MLNDKMKNVQNFSFINLAKKAFKYNKNIIGMKFLENEKSILTKLPKYIDSPALIPSPKFENTLSKLSSLNI